MQSIVRYFLVVLCVVGLTSSLATAQDLSAELAKVGTVNVRNYVNPIFNGFSADLNSGFYHSADLHGVLGFDVGLKVGLAPTTDADKKYDFQMPDQINFKNPQTGTTILLIAERDYDLVIKNVPTVVGDKNGVDVVVNMKSTSPYFAVPGLQGKKLITIPGGFNLPAVPLLMPQVAIGLPFGLEVMVRYIPTVSATDAGKFNCMGFGLRYNVDQWVPMLPLDIAVHFMTQKMNFKSKDDKDIFNATGIAYGIEASKKLLFLTVYGGIQLEKATFTLSQIDGKFTTPDGTETPFTIPEMTFEGKNKSRATLGVRLLLLIVNIHAEYSFAKTPVAAIGVGISFR
jgi:hypothetical protein